MVSETSRAGVFMVLKTSRAGVLAGLYEAVRNTQELIWANSPFVDDMKPEFCTHDSVRTDGCWINFCADFVPLYTNLVPGPPGTMNETLFI